MDDDYLIDTNILIDYLRSKKSAVEFLESVRNKLFISTLTITELFAGVNSKKEHEIIEEFLQIFHIFPIDHRIAKHAGILKNQYYKSHNVGIADALIAATAELYQTHLITLNKKHFPMLKNVIVPY